MSFDTRNNSAMMKRAEQLKRWEESETNREPSVPKSEKGRKIKFSSGCVFLAACLAGDKEEVVNLIENGADINTANVDGLTALHQACIDDNLDMVEFLVEHGADINRQDNEGWTPLHATASCGFVSIARYLVEHGADISAVNSDGELAVDLAVDIAHLSPMIEYMQKLVAEHNIDCDKARRAEEEMMLSDAKRWLRSDASEADNPHPKTGATALHVAAAKGYKKVLSLLLAGRANVDKQDNDGWTPLHAAAHWGQKESAEMLVDALADMDVRNYAGQTCIDVAERKMVKFLEDLRANNKRMKRRPSSQISSRISDTIENHIENTPTKFIRVEVKPDTKDPVNDDKPKLMPEKVNSETAIDEDAPWRRGSAARTRNQPESPPKNQVPEKDVKSTESDVILRRTQSFENDEKKPITSPPASPNTPVATPNSTAPTTPTTPNTTPIRRSFVPPVRDEESETQRKAHAKRVRETRRSTQGVTLDEIKSAEELVKKKNSTMNNNNNTSTESQNTTTTSSPTTTTTITTTTTTTTPSSPIKQQQQLPIQSSISAPSAIIITTTTTTATPLESTILTTTPTSPISPINDRVPSMTLDYESETIPPTQTTTTTTTTATTESTTKHSLNDEDEEEISATFTVAFNRTKPIHLTDDKIAEQIHSWSPTPPSTPPPIKSPTHTQPPPSITIEEHKDIDEDENIDEEEEAVVVEDEEEIEEEEKENEIEEVEEEKIEIPLIENTNEKEKKIESEEEESGATDEDEEEESSTSEEIEKIPVATPRSPTKNANNKTEECQKVSIGETLPTVPTEEKVTESQQQQSSITSSPMHSPRMRPTVTSPTDSPTRIREKRSLFDIDNANSLSLAEKLRNEANKYTTEDIGEETKVPPTTNTTVPVPVTTTTTTTSKPSSSSYDNSDNSDRDNVVVMRKSESTPSSPLHMSSAAERRPSWRLKFDIGCKFKLEDASSGTTFPPNNSTIIPSAPAVIAAANLSSSIAQRRINTTNAMNTSNQQQSSMMRPVSAPVGSMGSTNSIASHDSSDRSRDSNTNNSENTTVLSRRTTNNGEDKENDKENDNRSALATQAVIQRRRKPKRRSTGVVHIDMDDLEPERQDSAGDNEEKESGNERSSRSRLGSTVSVATDTDIGDTKSNSKDKTENGELIDYKALWEAAKLENDKLKQQLKKKDDEIIQARATVERFTNATTKNSLSEIEKRERRAMERKLSEMEEELKQLEVFKTENQRLKEENGALIRVISKLSK